MHHHTRKEKTMAMTTGSIIGGQEAYDNGLKAQNVGPAKETPRTSLEQAVKRLRQATGAVSNLRAEMVGEPSAEDAEAKPLIGGGFMGEVERASYEISQMASDIEQHVKAVLSRF